MRHLKIGGVCAGAMVAIGAVAMLLISGGTSGAIAGDAGSAAPESALAVQGEVARTGLVDKLEAALGDAFGGVWLDSGSAQLHVGVSAPASAPAAEEIAARVGLAANVAETPVRSSWAQLIDAQHRWNERLSALFERAEVATWRAPERNSVVVELGSSVPAAERGALEREAAASGVDISVVVAPYPRFRIEEQATRCNEFAEDKAFCDPTIVAGMTIKSEMIGGKRLLCTAGPATLPSDLTKETTETYLLTAGHCIEKWGKVGGKWYAVNKAGEEKEIGKAVEYLAKGSKSKADIGVIEINNGYWAVKTQTPVVPTIAPWNVKPEPEPFAVTGVANPVKGAESCLSGQTTGRNCGKIEKTGVTIEGLEELAEVKVTTESGDSGGPWSNKGSPATLEGTNVGIEEGTGLALFEPLVFSFAQLTTKLEPLTQANETRPLCPMKDNKCWIQAESYPVTYHGTNEVGKEKFTTEAGSVECASSFHGESATATLHPTYTKCKAFGFAEATVKTEGCNYFIRLKEKVAEDEFTAFTDVQCSAGSAIKITASTCEAEIGAQTGLATVKLKNDTGASPKKDITITPEITGVTFTVTKDGVLCPFAGTGKKTNGSYSSSNPLTITGQKPTESGTKIGIEAGL
jgi:hypothetical protein